MFSRVALGLARAAAVVGVVGFTSYSAKQALVADERFRRPTLAKSGNLDLVLYQYEVCPYCTKLKSFLDYNRVPYKTIEVNPLTREELKYVDVKRKRVPTMIINGEPMQESTEIMKLLCDAVPQPEQTQEQMAEQEKWLVWADERWVQALPPNIYRTMAEAKQSFDYILSQDNHFSEFQKNTIRLAGAAFLYGMWQRKSSQRGITDKRQLAYNCANEWSDALGDRTFLGGDAPNLADLAVYGILRCIEGLDTHRDILANSRIAPWYARMRTVVGPSCAKSIPYVAPTEVKKRETSFSIAEEDSD